MSDLGIKELAKLIGKVGFWRVGGLKIYIKVQDVRICYGKIQCLVAPVDDKSGGEVWTESAIIED